MITPYEYPELFRAMTLGTMASPGQVTFTGLDRNESWDVKQPEGSTGASSVYRGREIGQFQAEFFLADAEEQALWPAWQRLIESTVAGPTPVALPCWHPDLAQAGYTEIVSGGIGGVQRDARGGVTISVKFLEYRPPKPKPASTAKPKPGGASAGAGKPAPYDPNAERKRKVESLMSEAAKP